MDYKARSNRLILRVMAIADASMLLAGFFILGASLYWPELYAKMKEGFELKHLVIVLLYGWARLQMKPILAADEAARASERAGKDPPSS